MGCCNCYCQSSECNYELPKNPEIIFERSYKFTLVSKVNEPHALKMTDRLRHFFPSLKAEKPSKDGSGNYLVNCTFELRSKVFEANTPPVGDFKYNNEWFKVRSEVYSYGYSTFDIHYIAKTQKHIWCRSIPEIKEAAKEIAALGWREVK